MAPEHSGTMEIFDAFPRPPSTGKEQDTILPEQAVEPHQNLKVFLFGNMKKTVESADPIKKVRIELELSHVHLAKVRARHMDAC